MKLSTTTRLGKQLCIRPFALFTLFFFLLLFVIYSNTSSAGDNTYSFGLIPQEPALAMHKRWAPFIDRLSKVSGLPLKIKVYEHVNPFEMDLQNGVIDFVYMNSTQQVMAWQAQGYLPLVRSKKMLRGAMFVKKDSPLQTMDDLVNKDIAFVSLKSLCSVILRHQLLQNNKMADFNIIFAGSSSNVYKNVLLGKAAAGGTLDVSLQREPEEVISRLRILFQTEPVPPHPIAANPRISPDIRNRLISALFNIAEDSEGVELLKQVRMPPPLVRADYMRDYKFLEEIISQ